MLSSAAVSFNSYLLLALGLLGGFVPGRTALWAQVAAPITGGIHLVVIEGEGAINNIKQRAAREAVVEVQDDNHKPVAGAIVTFTLPGNGPSATFANGSNFLTVTTGADGRAAASNLRPNTAKGEYKINVRATHNGQSTTATITQVNALAAGAAGAGGISTGTVTIIAVAGAAAAGLAVGLVKALGNGSKSGKVTIGTPTVGTP